MHAELALTWRMGALSPMQLFSLRQRGQLDVYGLWGVLRGQLLTDDSFVFNRALTRIKTSVSHLAEAMPEDDEALLRLKVPDLAALAHALCMLCARACPCSPAVA